MKEARFFYVPNATETSELPVEEARHAVRVLRLDGGDEMFLMDGMGTFYRATVDFVSGNHCFYHIGETLPQRKGWGGRIHLAIAPTKMMDRMEWMAEKATEIGFDELSLLNCKYSERKSVRVDRLEKIIVAAVKQSRKPWMPAVNDMAAFRDFVSVPRRGARFITHCYDQFPRTDLFEALRQSPQDEDVAILVGPEGDFSVDEVELAMQAGWRSVSLGSARLRTETAGLMAVTMAQLAKRVL